MNKLLSKIEPSGIRRFFDIIERFGDVISLGVGEPDFQVDWNIREEAIYCIEKGATRYTSNQGLLELREEISRNIVKNQKIYYDPEREILVTCGVSQGLDLALRTILNPGDEVIIIEPCYVAYKPLTILSYGRPVVLKTSEENSFKIDLDELKRKISNKTKAIILNYPNNPTGMSFSKNELKEIADIANEFNLYIISDEIYDKLTYDRKHITIAKYIKEKVIYLNGFSKAYSMTGFRIGYICCDEELLRNMLKIHQYSMLCAPTISQYAAIEALRNEEKILRKILPEYKARRNYVYKRLNEMGLKAILPDGAFYIFPSIRSIGIESEKFSERLLFEKRVAVVPGNAFGEDYKYNIRISYANDMKKLKIAMDRIEEFVKEILKLKEEIK